MAADDTLADVRVDVARERRGRRQRAVALSGLVLFVLAGLAGGLGVRTAHAEARTDGLALSVAHPRLARGGLAVTFAIEVRQAGGFAGPIEVSLPTDYLRLFDENGTEPDPRSSTVDERRTTWEHDPPEGEVLVMWFDVRIEPGARGVRSATVTARTDDASVEVSIRTVVIP